MHQLKYYLHVICEGMFFSHNYYPIFYMHIFKSFFQSNFNILYIYIYTFEVVKSDKDALNQHGKIMW